MFRYFFILFFIQFHGFSEKDEVCFLDSSRCLTDVVKIEITEQKISLSDDRPNPVLALFKRKQKRNKKITAAVLAFPFPFGIVGLHRIYLGTKPFVPVVYIGSLGGGFGILPFIDFCVLVLDKNFDQYINNEKVFMWIKD